MRETELVCDVLLKCVRGGEKRGVYVALRNRNRAIYAVLVGTFLQNKLEKRTGYRYFTCM